MMRETKRKETKNMKIALFIIFIAIVWGGNHISKQLSQIIHLLKQAKEKKFNSENFEEDTKKQLYERYNKKKDYTDALSEWVKSHENDEMFQFCTGVCRDYSFSVNGQVIQKGQNKGKIEKVYAIVFTGQVWSYFDHLPDKQIVCDFSFIIHFVNQDKQAEPFIIGAYQDTYRDIIDDIQYYEGKHTITVECYENVRELEKYKLLISSGKKLGCRVLFEALPHKIKMDGNKINEKHLENIGKLTDYSIFEIEN